MEKLCRRPCRVSTNSPAHEPGCGEKEIEGLYERKQYSWAQELWTMAEDQAKLIVFCSQNEIQNKPHINKGKVQQLPDRGRDSRIERSAYEAQRLVRL